MTKKRIMASLALLMATAGVLLGPADRASAVGASDAYREKAEQAIEAGLQYLRSQQNEEGTWSPEAGPAVTALAVAGMVRQPGIELDDPMVASGLDYVLARQKEDGGIYDQILANYNTSISLMALGPIQHQDERIAASVVKAQDFLRALQWADAHTDPDGETITEGHPWFGGAGYGGHGRPDLSNTAMMIAGLNDSGLDCDDPAFQRAMNFVSMLQGTESNTTEIGEKIERDGGFVYATSTNSENIGEPQSMAGESEDEFDRSRLRTYGSMTYAGFMSYLYAELDRDDPRVQDAYNWIRQNYTLEENPGMGMQGYFYYLHLFSRAMAAWGEPTIETTDGEEHLWAHDLIDRLLELQNDDGSWNNAADRWMEDDPALCTAYAVLALQYALQ
ncbi:MAG: prenyltransferase/squalene oxidase repeat-containing protein [Phycisphaeraceae bacterium]